MKIDFIGQKQLNIEKNELKTKEDYECITNLIKTMYSSYYYMKALFLDSCYMEKICNSNKVYQVYFDKKVRLRIEGTKDSVFVQFF